MPDSEWYDEINPVLYGMLFQGWMKSREREYDVMKSIGILIGSFSNPQAAKEMLRSESADFQSSDEDFEKSLKMVADDVARTNSEKHRRRRRPAKDMTNG